MTTKTNFKGFTFKKFSRQFVPPPPGPKPCGTGVAQGSSVKTAKPSLSTKGSLPSNDSTSKYVASKRPGLPPSSSATSSKPFQSVSGASDKASAGASGLPGSVQSNVQTSVRTFFNLPSARPVATVTPQGHSNSGSAGSAVLNNTANPPCSSAKMPTATSAANGIKRKRSDDIPVKSLSVSILQGLDDDDDDDFDMPSITPVTPKQKLASTIKTPVKEKAADSDDEILPVRKRRSMVLHSDDEGDGSNELDGSLFSPSPVQAARSSQESRFHPSLQTRPVGSGNTNSFNRNSTVSSQTRVLTSSQAPTRDPHLSPVCSTPLTSSQTSPGLTVHQNASVHTSASPLNVRRPPSVPEAQCGGSGGKRFVASGAASSGLRAGQSSILGQCIGSTSTGGDVTAHPLLKADASKLSPEQVGELQSLLLRVADEVCDIICSASTAALMNLGLRDYGRLQTLLAVRKQIKDKEKATKASSASSTSPASCRRSSENFHTPKPSSFVGFDPDAGDSSCCQLMSPPVAASTAVKKIPVTKVPSVTESPVPCGDSFFEDVNAFTQSHMSYMRGFKTPTAASPATGPSLMQRRDSLPDLSEGEGPSSMNRRSSGLLQRSPVAGSEMLNCAEGSSNYLMPTSEDSPIVLSQENFGAGFIEADGDDFDEMDYPVPIREESSFKKPAAPANNSNRFSSGQLNESFDDLIDEFDDDGGGFDFGDVNIESADTHAVAGTSSGSADEGASVTDPYIPTFGSTDKDDGATGEFDGEQFEHSQEMREVFHNIFGLREFRHNQLQALNSALLGNDCFILMPTGGGKSLCYQLPSLVKRGVSIIVSPLRALIQDQVQRLISLDIPAAHLSGDLDSNQANNVYSALYQRHPGVKLLYVTPEKLSASDKLLQCLDSLYRRQMLDRFVIDEAHCVSQWGHDFRPDYKKLNVLRCKFPGVPIMALTATATPRVRKDIIHQLDMLQPKWFMQSFNRPNLKYVVNPKKPSTVTKDIIQIIKSKFKNECGIVYCLSRNECDTTADNLQKAGIQATAYHAGLSDGDRISVQERWLNGDNCKVICATIAFGMGIDKADVRFVVHFSLPKSVEGYYQEAGRAGRDGMIAHCILFYTYSDVMRLRRIIDLDQSATYESKRVHIDNLFRMVQYCENMADCRRAQVLHYFGEHHFDRDRCNIVPGAVCDNCSSKDMFKLRDVTEDAKEVVKCVKELTSSPRKNFTLIHFVEIFKGSQNTRIMDNGHNRLGLHGRGAAYSRGDAERLMHKLVVEGVLVEELKITAADTTACYVRLGPKAGSLTQNKFKIEMAVQGGSKRSEASRIGQEPQTNRQQLVEDCYKELVALAKTIATEHGSKNYALIFPNATLWQLAEKTPLTVEEMKREIDGLPETKINKYGAHRFTDITTKYCVMLASIQDEMEDDSQSTAGGAGEWASPYFDNSSANSGGRKKTFGRQRGRGGKSRGGKKGKAAWKR
ncbi:hypothetical protein V1264_002393 [Littorina saxatilis]|uniref:RecQ-like DNA helicase BLM n=1 Tax=Littorina saxatilis TaxID=31220 RepID=A0AAN9C3Y8_9CAEN